MPLGRHGETAPIPRRERGFVGPANGKDIGREWCCWVCGCGADLPVCPQAAWIDSEVEDAWRQTGGVLRSYFKSGSAKATTASPSFVPSLPCPPAQIRTYCFPLTSYVMGTAWAPAGSAAFHSTLPVSMSNARRWLSMLAAMKTKPPAVVIGPPRLSEPHCSASGYLCR